METYRKRIADGWLAEALEVKGVGSLQALAGKVDGKKTKPPAFRMVVVADGDFAYRRKEDGVLVCPISCLRP